MLPPCLTIRHHFICGTTRISFETSKKENATLSAIMAAWSAVCLWDLWPWYNSMIEEPTQRRWKYFWLLQGTQSVTIIQAKSKITKCMWCLSKMIVCFRDEPEYTVHLQQAKDVSREFLYSNSDTFLTRRWFATNVANDLTAHVTSHVGHHFKHEFAFSFAV